MFFPRRLYLAFRWGKECHFTGSYAGSMPVDCRAETTAGSTPAEYKFTISDTGIGIDSETARLVFTSKQGEGVAATVVDLGNRFRLIVNVVDCIKSKKLPKLPVASALWIPQPNLEVGAGAWILAGGTHHTSFSYDLTTEYWEDYAEIAGIEMVHINKDTTISCFKKELRMNEVYYMLNKALC